MKKLPLLLALMMLLSLSPVLAEGVNPFMEVPVDNESLETLTYTKVDFGAGAALLRFKGASGSKLVIKVYADSMEGNPIATAVFISVTKENRCKINAEGVHDLYFTFEGEGTFTSWQAYTSQEELDAAIKAERGTVYEDQVPSASTARASQGLSMKPAIR